MTLFSRSQFSLFEDNERKPLTSQMCEFEELLDIDDTTLFEFEDTNTAKDFDTEESSDSEVPSSECSTPENNLKEEKEKWEEELEYLLKNYKPTNEELKETMLSLSVKDFNTQAKALKLDETTLQWLKIQRKRSKNRLAALKSRSKRETLTSALQRRVDELVAENQSQAKYIKELEKRIRQTENRVSTRSKAK